MYSLGDARFLLRVSNKRLQSDDLTTVDSVPETTKLVKKLQTLDKRPLPRGREKSFTEELDEDEAMKCFGKELWQEEHKSNDRKCFISETRFLRLSEQRL